MTQMIEGGRLVLRRETSISVADEHDRPADSTNVPGIGIEQNLQEGLTVLEFSYKGEGAERALGLTAFPASVSTSAHIGQGDH